MVLNNTISTRKFVTRPNPEGTFKDIQPNFGIIKGLHLDYLEFASKIKKGAPIIPEPTFSGKLDEPKSHTPRPAIGTSIVVSQDDKKSEKSRSKESSRSRSRESVQEVKPDKEASHSEDPYGTSSSSVDTEEDEFFNKFGNTPAKKSPTYKETPVAKSEKSEEHSEEKKKRRKYMEIPKPVEPELPPPEEPEPVQLTEEEQFIRDEIERRTNIVALRKAKVYKQLDLGDIPDDMDLQTTRILKATTDKQLSIESSISMNRFALVGLFMGIDKGCEMFTDKMKGYFQYQMEIINVYDSYLEAIGETNLTLMFQQLDPSVQLGGVVSLTTAGFFLFQNFIGEDKVKGAKLIQSLFPGKSKIIEEMTEASKKVKEDKQQTEQPQKKKRRGPTFTAGDVNNMDE